MEEAEAVAAFHRDGFVDAADEDPQTVHSDERKEEAKQLLLIKDGVTAEAVKAASQAHLADLQKKTAVQYQHLKGKTFEEAVNANKAFVRQWSEQTIDENSDLKFWTPKGSVAVRMSLGDLKSFFH